jgi:hypothetical protein
MGVAAGNVFPFEQARRRHAAPDDQPVLPELSPELVLVDPELAEHARAQLHEPGCFRPRGAEPPRPLVTVAPPAEIAGASEQPSIEAFAQPAGPGITEPRMRARIVVGGWLVAFAAGLLVGGLALTLAGRDPAPAPATERQTTVAPAPAAQPQATPTRPTTAAPSPTKLTRKTLAWAPAAGAASYETALYRGSIQVFSARTTEPRVTISSPWRYGGRLHRLEAGAYRWYVWPITADGKKATLPVVQAVVAVGARG